MTDIAPWTRLQALAFVLLMLLGPGMLILPLYLPLWFEWVFG
jgi:hypothetical protein